MHDFSGTLKLAAARKWAVVAIDLGVDTSSPTGKLVADVMMSVAEWEREVIGERTSAAMQAAKRQGRHMGRVSALPQSTGDRLLALRATLTVAGAAAQLNAEGLTTATGAQWSANTVANVQQRLTATKDMVGKWLKSCVGSRRTWPLPRGNTARPNPCDSADI